jgi:hypothetical protein
MIEIFDTFQAIDLVYRGAKASPKFRHFTGEDLALAIHHSHHRSLPEVVDRAFASFVNSAR